MIYFITSNSDHPTNKGIINYFKNQNNEIPFEVLSPLNDLEFIDQKLKKSSDERETLIILKPDHQRIYDICEIVTKYNLNSINHVEITKLFKNRWNVEKKIKNYLDLAKENGKLLNFKIPEFWYINSSNIKRNDELDRFIEKTKIFFQDKFPMVVKYPFYHEGIHFIRLISNIENLNPLIRNFKDSGLILQNFIEGTENIIKCYSIGENYFSFRIEHNLINYSESENLSNEVTLKAVKNKISTPHSIHEFMEFIRKFLNIDLFGCDFIEIDDFYYFIDINDFPGFQGVLNVDKIISKYFVKKSIN